MFSAISSAFVIDVQSKLEPDSSERSEAYLRAILLSLNRSTAPDEDPIGPPVWSGPPTGIVATSNLLYASLVMSLLSAFVAMLGKQWLNRYLRHAGGSVIERCGDRQRKFDALEKWPFRIFFESLPIMLQIALLLLACGLSRYMWSVNVSVARVIISFTVLGLLFYLMILVIGTSSYECPFRAPAMMALLYFRDTILKLFAILPPPKFISIAYATLRASLSRTISGIHRATTKVSTSLLLWLDQTFQNTKRGLVQVIGILRPATLLPTTVEDATHQPLVPQTRAGLRVHVWNLDNIQRQNADNARCVCWILRNITDPEAIDSAIRLAGTIRWFDGDSDDNPPLGSIVSVFKACFDSTKQLHPNMRDRAYFSARAILQINTRARTQSCKRASKYPIPADSSSSSKSTDPDLRHILHMLELNSNSDRPIFDFPRGDTNTHAHLLWMSNLFVDLARVGPNLTLESYESYLSTAIVNHKPTIANTLLAWSISMGGQVEEETFWAVDKSYVMVSLPLLSLSPLKIFVRQRFIGNHTFSLISKSGRCY